MLAWAEDGSLGATRFSAKLLEMAGPGRLKASLIVNGEDVDPDEVTRLLGSRPDRSYRVGDLVSSHSPTRRRTGHWSISTEGVVPEAAPLEEHVAQLLSRVTNDVGVWNLLTARHDARVFVGWFMETGNEGLAIPPSLLAGLVWRSLTGA